LETTKALKTSAELMIELCASSKYTTDCTSPAQETSRANGSYHLGENIQSLEKCLLLLS